LGAISESWTGLRPTVAACLLVCSSFSVPARRLRARAALIQPTFIAELRPPLATELFELRPSFTRILHEYPLAEQAAADIREVLSSGSIALEAFLRDRLRDSEHQYRRRQYWAIPLYLQHLLFEVSYWEYGLGSGYTAHPNVYDRLVNATLRVPEVTFVTLNYDTLLDDRLFMTGGPVSIESYLAPDENRALIKPHGSIDWGRRVLNAPRGAVGNDPFLARVFASLGDQISLDDEITLRPARSISAMRGFAEGNIPVIDGMPAAFYPALSAPLGAPRRAG
jgi:hypothetical protein